MSGLLIALVTISVTFSVFIVVTIMSISFKFLMRKRQPSTFDNISENDGLSTSSLSSSSSDHEANTLLYDRKNDFLNKTQREKLLKLTAAGQRVLRSTTEAKKKKNEFEPTKQEFGSITSQSKQRITIAHIELENNFQHLLESLQNNVNYLLEEKHNDDSKKVIAKRKESRNNISALRHLLENMEIEFNEDRQAYMQAMILCCNLIIKFDSLQTLKSFEKIYPGVEKDTQFIIETVVPNIWPI